MHALCILGSARQCVNFVLLACVCVCVCVFHVVQFVLWPEALIGERERSLPSRPNGAIFLYIYLYPALMYAVMFYVILNKRKLHFPLAKNVMHSPSIVYIYASGHNTHCTT